MSIPPIEAEATLTYLGGRFPATGFLTTVDGVQLLAWPRGIVSGFILMALFFVLNYFGAKFLAESNRWVTWWKIALPTLTFIFLFFILNGSNFTSYGGFAPLGVPPIFHAIATTGIIFSLLGFRGTNWLPVDGQTGRSSTPLTPPTLLRWLRWAPSCL